MAPRIGVKRETPCCRSTDIRTRVAPSQGSSVASRIDRIGVRFDLLACRSPAPPSRAAGSTDSRSADHAADDGDVAVEMARCMADDGVKFGAPNRCRATCCGRLRLYHSNGSARRRASHSPDRRLAIRPLSHVHAAIEINCQHPPRHEAARDSSPLAIDEPSHHNLVDVAMCGIIALGHHRQTLRQYLLLGRVAPLRDIIVLYPVDARPVPPGARRQACGCFRSILAERRGHQLDDHPARVALGVGRRSITSRSDGAIAIQSLAGAAAAISPGDGIGAASCARAGTASDAGPQRPGADVSCAPCLPCPIGLRKPRQAIRAPLPEHAERWPSGRRRSPGK